jgi:hypothetical protein
MRTPALRHELLASIAAKGLEADGALAELGKLL